MKVITGHLTASNKKAIKAILKANLTAGKVGKTSYFLSVEGEVYTVKIQKKDRGMVPVCGSRIRLSTYTATFLL